LYLLALAFFRVILMKNNVTIEAAKTSTARVIVDGNSGILGADDGDAVGESIVFGVEVGERVGAIVADEVVSGVELNGGAELVVGEDDGDGLGLEDGGGVGVGLEDGGGVGLAVGFGVGDGEGGVVKSKTCDDVLVYRGVPAYTTALVVAFGTVKIVGRLISVPFIEIMSLDDPYSTIETNATSPTGAT
jgi:hypothetical protein